RYVDRGVGEACRTEPPRRATKGQDLGVSGRILGAQRLVVRASDDRTARDDDRADRHLTAPLGSPRFVEGSRHSRGRIARVCCVQQLPEYVQTLNESPPLGAEGVAMI